MVEKKDNLQTVTAELKGLRMTARKVMLVTRAINHKPIPYALSYLNNTPKRAGKPVLKLLNSVIANAIHNDKLDLNNLVIDTIFVNEGRTLKRIRPRAKGVAYPILKRSSHVKIVLKNIEGTEQKVTKNVKRNKGEKK